MTRRPDVLFVVLDSVRRDRVSLYGHDRETTPVLGQFAEGATVYENAYTPAPWTLPSHLSMFTGRFPSEHGVTNGFTDRDLRLPAGIPTITERLTAAGYRAAGFSNNPWVGSLSGLAEEFDEFVEWDLEIKTSSDADIHNSRQRLYSYAHTLLGQAARQPVFALKRNFFTSSLVDRARTWLSTADETASRPMFTFLNLMEAHSPYFPPASAFRDLGLDPPSVMEPRLLNTRLLAYTMEKTTLEGRRERVLEYYDASLRYQDGKLGELLAGLAESGRFDETLVVICADHGKTLGEYDRDATPPHYLRDINTNVPLVIKYPGQQQRVDVERPVELSRLFETIVDGGRTRLEAVIPDDGCALTEDFVPHAGRRSTEVTCWRRLTDGVSAYVRDETNESYLLGPEAPDEVTPLRNGEEPAARLRQRLDERVADLDERAAEGERGAGGRLSRGVESQLSDLGYLN